MKNALILQPIEDCMPDEIDNTYNRAECALKKRGYEAMIDVFSARGPNKDRPTEFPLFCLSRKMKLLSMCDAVYICRGWQNDRACMVLRLAASLFGLTMIDEGEERKTDG